MPPAVIAGVGAAASIGGGLLGASATKKAANTAANAQLQTTQQNNALARELYDRNSGNFQPFMQSGQRANALLDSFIYGNSQPQQQAPAYQPQPSMYEYVNNPGTPRYVSQGGGFSGSIPIGEGADGWSPQYGGQPNGAMSMAATPGAVTTNVPNAQNAWDTFRNSTNYQFRLGEGMNALNSGWAGNSALQSGAAAKDAIRYGQNFASNELNNYLSLLQGQQALGAGSASSLAGVGNDFLSSVTANNRSAADAASNAALLRGQANQQLYGGIANALGGFASSFGKGF